MEYEIYHFGVKGMKWGVRRYQNKDGTLTNAGKKRLSEKIVKADSRNNSAKVNRLTNEAVESYKKTSTSYSSAKKAYDVLKDKETQMEKTANDAAAKKVGMTMDEIKRKGEHATDLNVALDMYVKANQYTKEGNAVLQDLMSKTDYKKTVSEYKAAYQKAHSDGLAYVKSYMGEYGDIPLKNPMSITYDMKNDKVRPTTVAERMSTELTRDIWLRGR